MAKVIGLFGAIAEEHRRSAESLGYRWLYSSGNFSLGIRDDKLPVTLAQGSDGFAIVTGRPIPAVAAGRKGDVAERLRRNLAQTILEDHACLGDAVFGYLEGSYFAAVWDEVMQELQVSRDGAGLAYHTVARSGTLCFSNHLADLVRVSRKTDISSEALAEYLRFLDISPPYTIYHDVYFLEPDNILRSRGGEWETVERDGADAGRDYGPSLWEGEDPVAILEGLLKSAIARNTEGVTRLGGFLSGGIDSSLICALARDICPGLKAYTVGFPDPVFDESGIARKVAHHLDLKHEVLVFGVDEDRRAFDDFTAAIASPFADPAIIPTFQCVRRIADEVDVVLDGTGADTSIGIMPARHVRFILRVSRHLPRQMRQAIGAALRLTRKSGTYAPMFDFGDEVELLIRWRGWNKREIARLRGTECDLSQTLFYRLYRHHYRETPYRLYSLLMGALPDDRIHQSAALFGASVAFPFFDQGVRDYIRDLPKEWRYAKGESKVLLRRILERHVPRDIWDVSKHGFDYAFEKLLAYRDFELVHAYLSPAALASHGLFDPEMAGHCAERFLAGDLSVKFKVWALAIFQAWYERSYRSL